MLTPSSICFLILCFLPLYSLWIQITSTRTRVHHVHPPTQTSSTLHNGLNPERCCSPPCLASKYVISNISFYNKGFGGPSSAILVLWVMKLYQIIEIYLEIPAMTRTITEEDTTITFSRQNFFKPKLSPALYASSVFRCASISCTDDRNSLIDNWRLAILHVCQFSHHPSRILLGGNICLVCLVILRNLQYFKTFSFLYRIFGTDFQSC